MTRKTQGRALIELLKTRPMTYRQMLQASRSTSPWRRVKESLGVDEAVALGQDPKGWTTWRIVRSTKWPA